MNNIEMSNSNKEQETKKRIYISTNLLMIIGAIVGAVGGYFYWKYVGCVSGTCPIFAAPWSNVIWGGAIGALLFSIVGDIVNRSKNRKKK